MAVWRDLAAGSRPRGGGNVRRYVGVTDPLSPNGVPDADEALTEDIVAYSAEAEGQLEDL